MANHDPVKFSIDVVGDETGDRHLGDFEAKTLLSHRDRITYDQKRREALGGINPDYASLAARERAEIFADFYVRITKAPTWWVTVGGGWDLLDNNVISTIHDHVIRIENEHRAAIKKAAEEAKAALRASMDEEKK